MNGKGDFSVFFFCKEAIPTMCYLEHTEIKISQSPAPFSFKFKTRKIGMLTGTACLLEYQLPTNDQFPKVLGDSTITFRCLMTTQISCKKNFSKILIEVLIMINPFKRHDPIFQTVKYCKLFPAIVKSFLLRHKMPVYCNFIKN